MVKQHIQEARDLKNFLLEDEKFLFKIESVINVATNCLKKGHKILIAGNGGSASASEILAAALRSLNLPRLREVKKQVDPDDRFQLTQGIRS